MDIYEEVDTRIRDIYEKLKPFAKEENLHEIEQIRTHFDRKVKDFFREERKLNIGVIGRVKAGKSSFLNTLLFQGEEILPKAATPKTAALTKMEYAEENRVVIEFYSPEDWEDIEKDALLCEQNEWGKSARELVDMARERGIDVPEILKEQRRDETFGEYRELIDFLNSYVGENGKYTPLVRSVSIYMNREEFKDISIVDTPGLNDTILSRTQKTKEFLEVCDVVFFLSRAGSFLDENDWLLLREQLPEKGVKRIVLVASQCDGGLRDVLKKDEKKGFFEKQHVGKVSKATNIPDAHKLVAASLEKRVREKIASLERDENEYIYGNALQMLKKCEKPILISARLQDMSAKKYQDYSQEEREDYRYWKDFIEEPGIAEEFSKIGNFEEIRQVYDQVKTEKEHLLEEKQKEFVPNVYRRLRGCIDKIKEETRSRLSLLQNKDRGELNAIQAHFKSRMDGVKADVSEVFGDTVQKIKQRKSEVSRSLREMELDAVKLETRTDTETHQEVYETYRFRFLFIRLGKKIETNTYTTAYTYLAASDALEQLIKFGKMAANEIEGIFREAIDIKVYRRKIVDAVVRNLDFTEEGTDVNYFRIVVQNALNRIDFSEVKIDVSNGLAEISSQFSGRVRDNKEQDRFRSLFFGMIEGLSEMIAVKVADTIKGFLESMREIEETLCNGVLEKIEKEFSEIQAAIEEKEAEISRSQTYLSLLDEVIAGIPAGTSESDGALEAYQEEEEF